MARKKATVTMYPSTGASAPIRAKIYGSVSYTSDGPAPGSRPAENTAGIMAKPAIRAKAVSETAVHTPTDRIPWSFFINEE